MDPYFIEFIKGSVSERARGKCRDEQVFTKATRSLPNERIGWRIPRLKTGLIRRMWA
jgi:hypothetical protein